MNNQKTRVTLPIEDISIGIEELLRHYSIKSLLYLVDQVNVDWNDYNLELRLAASSNASSGHDVFDSTYQSPFRPHQTPTFSRAAIDNRVERITLQADNISNVEGIGANGLEQAQIPFNSRPERGNLIPDSSLNSQILRLFLSASQLRQSSYPKGETTSSRAVESFNAIDAYMLQDIEVGRTKLSAGLKSLATVIGGNFQISSSISESTLKDSVSSEKSPYLQLRTNELSISRPEKRSSDIDPEFGRVKKAIDMLERLSSEKASKPEKAWEGIKEFGLPDFMVEAFKEVIKEFATPGDIFKEKPNLASAFEVWIEKKRLEKALPGDLYSSARHQAGAAFAAQKIGPIDARTAGILNEFIGGYEISDLIDNEIGFANAGFSSYAYEILQYVRQNAELSVRYANEIKGNPFRHIGIELARNHPERYNLGSSISPKPENRYTLGASKSYESGETAANTGNASGARGYNLGVRLPEVRSIDSSPYNHEGFQERNQPKNSAPSGAESPKSSGSGSSGENKDPKDSGTGSRGGAKDNSGGHYDRVGGPRTDNIA
jgi:hypothetical protein